MTPNTLIIKKLVTERLSLVPFTKVICVDLLNNHFESIEFLGFKRGVN